MARGRMISKSWSTSRKRAALYREAGELAEFCLQLFPLIVTHSDDYGRFDGDAETVKLTCDPGSPRSFEEFEQGLIWFERVRLIQRFDADGKRWLQILKFDAHQPGLLSNRTKSKSPIPPPLTEFPENSVLTKPNLTEPNLTEKNRCAEVNSALEPAAMTLLVFPVVGVGPKTWVLTTARVSEWQESFPGLGIEAEARKALAWLNANPGRRKTARGMPAFLVRWLSRAVDSGRNGRVYGVPTAGKLTTRLASAIANIKAEARR